MNFENRSSSVDNMLEATCRMKVPWKRFGSYDQLRNDVYPAWAQFNLNCQLVQIFAHR